jgi:hypothetical protein
MARFGKSRAVQSFKIEAGTDKIYHRIFAK